VRSLGDRRTVSDAVVVLGVFLVLGVLCGMAWWLLVEPAEFTKARGGTTMGEVELSRRFDVDGWYAVVALVAGFVAGLVLTWRRARDFRVTTVLVVLGSVLAAAVTALVGGVLGPGDPDAALASAARGAEAPVRLVVTAEVTYLMWPIGVLAGAIMVLWSSTRPDAQEQADQADRAVATDPHGSTSDAATGGPPDPLNPARARG